MRCECFRFLERAVFCRPSAFFFVKKYSRIAGDGVPNSAGKFLCLGTPSLTPQKNFCARGRRPQLPQKNFCTSRRRRRQPQRIFVPRDSGANNLKILTHLATPSQATSQNFWTSRRQRRQPQKKFVPCAVVADSITKFL